VELNCFDWRVKLKIKITQTKRKIKNNKDKIKKKTHYKLGLNGEVKNQ
jgi:hypothetical protein